MNVVDSSAWLSWFAGDGNAAACRHRATVWTQDSDFKDLPDVRFYTRRP